MQWVAALYLKWGAFRTGQGVLRRWSFASLGGRLEVDWGVLRLHCIRLGFKLARVIGLEMVAHGFGRVKDWATLWAYCLGMPWTA